MLYGIRTNGGLAFFGILSLARTLSPMWRSWSLGLRLALALAVALALAFLRAFDSWSFSRTAGSGDLAMVGNIGSQSSCWGYSLRTFTGAVMRRYSDVAQKAVYHSSQVSFFYWTGRFSRLPGTSGEWNVLCKYITRVMPFSKQIGLSRKIVYLIYLVHSWVCLYEEGGKVSLLSHIKTAVFYSSQ